MYVESTMEEIPSLVSESVKVALAKFDLLPQVPPAEATDCLLERLKVGFHPSTHYLPMNVAFLHPFVPWQYLDTYTYIPTKAFRINSSKMNEFDWSQLWLFEWCRTELCNPNHSTIKMESVISFMIIFLHMSENKMNWGIHVLPVSVHFP